MPTFARNQIASALRKRVDAHLKGYRQNVGLLGSAGLGKTDLLSAAYREFSAHPNLLCAYVRAESLDFENLADRWAGALLAGYCRSECLQIPDAREFVHSDTLEARIPKTFQMIQKIRRSLHKEPQEALLQNLFALSGVLTQESGKKLILMLDDFQEMGGLPCADPFGLLGREIMVQKDTLYLVSSSHPERAREIFREKLSLLFGNFEVMELRPFDFQETADFISRHFPKTTFSTPQKKLLIDLTNGDPLYLDLILDRLKFYLSPETEEYVSDGLLFLALREELLDHKGRIALLFERILDPLLRQCREGSASLRVLAAVASGRHRLGEIASSAGIKTQEAQKILQKLVHDDHVRKWGTFFLMEDPLFRFWLREVFLRKQKLCVPDESAVGTELLGAMRRRMELMAHEDEKFFFSRVERLFKEFRQDAVEMEARKMKCPQFLEVACHPAEGRFSLLEAKNQKQRWLCLVADRHVLEEDVLALMDLRDKPVKKTQQKIIIALAGIDQNAKLMAQTAKIQLWGLRELNSLLAAFDLPKLMIFEDRKSYGPSLGALAQSLYSS